MTGPSTPLPRDDCPFCNRERVAANHLFDGDDFYIIGDHEPIAAAHLLLIPREHHPYLAALPPRLHAEFEALKAMAGSFIQRHYGRVSFWENGGFGQTVPHAHLHAFSLSIEPAVFQAHGVGFRGIAGLSETHARAPGGYFMVEHAGEACLLPPDWDVYRQVIDHARARSDGRFVRDRAARRVNGVPLFAALKDRWRADAAVTDTPPACGKA